MYTRAQVGSPVYMKIKEIPENFIKDEGNTKLLTNRLTSNLIK